MSLVMAHGQFGEADIRLLKLLRKGDRHDLRDLSVSVVLQGDFERGFSAGERIPALSAGAIGERVYALARDHCGEQIEPFALTLAEHFRERFERVAEATVSIEEKLWQRVTVDGRPRNRAFTGGGEERRLAEAVHTAAGKQIQAGFTGMPILKTMPGNGEGPPRILAGTIAAVWRYGWADVPFGLHWQQVRQVVLETFADHAGHLVQHVLHGMALAALDQCPAIAEIRISVDASSYRPADLSRLGMTGTEDLLVPGADPHGVIELLVSREEIG